jgi:F-type H+-transporting ATPase subunit b
MNVLTVAVQTAEQSAGQIETIARTFGVDWPHLAAQIVSFGVVCLVLYLLAYTPILAILQARRQQIADGLANAAQIKAELARIEVDRRAILSQAGDEGKQLIQEARAAAARLQAAETVKARQAADRLLTTSRETAEREHARMLADLRREVGALAVQVTAAATGKILTPDDQRRLAEETVRQLGAP